MIYIITLILLSFLHLLFAFQTNTFFSTDDFFVLAYFKDHNLVSTFNFLIEGDIFGFRKFLGYFVFGGLFKLFGANHLVFDLSLFFIHTANVLILFLITKKLTKNSFAAFFVSVIFNKNYLFYYSNIHEYLVFLFSLLTIYLFISYPKKFFLTVSSFLLALFSKEVAIFVPIALYAISYFKDLDRRRILYLLLISLIWTVLVIHSFVSNKAGIVGNSYELGFYNPVDIKILVLGLLLPLITKKWKYLPLFLVFLISLLPASLLITRQESYYLYMPFSFLMIYISLFLPKLNLRTSVFYILIFILFGGRSVLPKIAWQEFPNWQKESIKNVVQGKLENPERDAKLMLDSGTLDLFTNLK